MWALIPIAWKLGIVALSIIAVVATMGGVVFKIKHDAVLSERARVEQEKDDAIRKVDKVKQILRQRCANDPSSCVPDEWFRD